MFKKTFSLRRERIEINEEAEELEEDNFSVETDLFRRSGEPATALVPNPFISPRAQFNVSRLLASSETQSEASSEPLEALSDLHPLGLNIVYSPPNDRVVDIIFVHGLNGGSRRTWMKGGDAKTFWPLEFLPKEPQLQNARILTFGYNSDFGKGKSNLTILDFAKELLFDMKYRVDHRSPALDLNTRQAPIVFVAHSMGGLIVKKAYSLGQTDPAFHDVTKAVRAMIFLSTPHRGSNLAATLNRILRVTSITSPRKFVDDMRTDSTALAMLNEEFRHHAPNLDIVSFYETRPSNIGTSSSIVVERDSSVLSYPNEISAPLDADHASICKFSSSTDPSYIAVRNTLIHLIAKVGQSSTETLAKVNETAVTSFNGLKIEAQKTSAFSWAPDSPEKDLVRLRMQRTKDTCKWILNHPSYVEWTWDQLLRSQHILWIYGDAASGKSTLASFVVDHLVERGVCCQYFFFKYMYAKKEKMSIGVALRSLAHQLAGTYDDYARKLHQLEDEASDLEAAHYRTIWQKLFEQRLFEVNMETPLYWVIDGLDEADDPGTFIKLLSEFSTTAIPIRVLVFSRQIRTISSVFQKIRVGNSFHANSFRMEGNSDDLQRYINEELEIPGDEKFIAETSSQLLALCQGNFLWIQSTCQKINHCHTKAEVHIALERLDAAMEPLYDQMAASLSEKNTADNPGFVFEILGWICCIQRRLTTKELHAALGDRGLFDLSASIVQLCSGFVVVTPDGQIDLIHRTAREYLMRKTSQVETPIVDRETAHAKICLRCLECLSDPKLRLLNNRIRGSDFFDYAANFWFMHLNQVKSVNHKMLEAVIAFLSGPSVLIWISMLARKKQLASMVKASRCLTTIASRLSKRGAASKIPYQIFSRVSVLTCWAEDLVQILGKFGRILTQRPESIHKLIPPLCPENSLISSLLGEKEPRPLKVSGMKRKSWGECLSSIPLERGLVAKSVHALHNHFLIVVDKKYSSYIYAYNPATFELEVEIAKESVLLLEVDTMSGRALGYGRSTTTLWDFHTGYSFRPFPNPEKEVLPLALSISGDVAMLCFEDLSIYSTNMADKYPFWELILQLHDHLTLNSTMAAPCCSSFSPDGTMVAFGCRGHSITVWDLVSGDFVGHCNFIRGDVDSDIEGTQQGDMIQLAWHLSSMTIFGLRRDGLLFKWDIYEEEPSCHVQADARALSYSPDGLTIATTGDLGTVKVFSARDFHMVDQFPARSPGVDISFSSDSRMLYDLREGHSNVWTSTALNRLMDSCDDLDSINGLPSEPEGMADYTTSCSGQHEAIWIPIISAQSQGSLYCHNTESGMIILSEVGFGRVCGVEKRARTVCIEQIVWSQDDSLLAILDSSGRLTAKKVIKDDSTASPRTEHLLDIIIPTRHGPCLQALFFPGNDRLFIAFSAAIIIVNITSNSYLEHPESLDQPSLKWACHPLLPTSVLGFGITNLCIYDCDDLSKSKPLQYFPERVSEPRNLATALLQPGEEPAQNPDEAIGRLLRSSNGKELILELSAVSPEDASRTDYLVFAMSDIFMLEGSSSGLNLPYVQIPEEVAVRTLEPLALLSSRRLLFLDSDRWICTWCLDTTGSVNPQGQISDADGTGVEQHYALPSDWAIAEEVRRCTATSDGTVLIPRDGDVVAVTYNKLRSSGIRSV